MFYSFCMLAVVDIVSRRGLSIDMCHTNQPNKSKLAMYGRESQRKEATYVHIFRPDNNYWNYLQSLTATYIHIMKCIHYQCTYLAIYS